MSTTKKTGKKKAAKKATRKKTPAKKKPEESPADKQREWVADRVAQQLAAVCIDEIRNLQQPWSKTPEAEQSVIIARISEQVRRSTREAALAMSARGQKAVVCNLFSVTFKDGVRAVVTMPPGSEMRHELADRATQDCVLVFADPERFMEGLDEIEPDKDQPELL